MGREAHPPTGVSALRETLNNVGTADRGLISTHVLSHGPLASVARWTRCQADDGGVYADQYNTPRQMVLAAASVWFAGSYPWIVGGIVGVLYCRFAFLGVLYGTRYSLLGNKGNDIADKGSSLRRR